VGPQLYKSLGAKFFNKPKGKGGMLDPTRIHSA